MEKPRERSRPAGRDKKNSDIQWNSKRAFFFYSRGI